MLNTTNIKMGSNTSNVVLNTPSTGMIQRSHPKSFFIRFHSSSAMCKMVFPPNGEGAHSHEQDEYPRKRTFISVLQMLVYGDDWFMVEVVKVEDLTDEVDTNS
jgi:hypothetical protein